MERFYWIILWKKQKSLDAEQYALKEIFGKLGLCICNSFADFSGKPSSDNDIQLMVYSIRDEWEFTHDLALCLSVNGVEECL